MKYPPLDAAVLFAPVDPTDHHPVPGGIPVKLETAGRLALLTTLILTATVALAAPAIITLPADPPSTRSVELVEQWRIGGEDDEEILLGVIFDAVIGTDGSVYLIDRQLSQVLVISPDGELLTTLGRQGKGPGS